MTQGLASALSSCRSRAKATCHHLKSLAGSLKLLPAEVLGRPWEDLVRDRFVYRLARVLVEGDRAPSGVMGARWRDSGAAEDEVAITDPAGRPILRYLDRSSSRLRFLERLGKVDAQGPVRDRGRILEHLRLAQVTPEERRLNDAGLDTRRQAFEQSLWQVLAYHLVRDFPKAR